MSALFKPLKKIIQNEDEAKQTEKIQTNIQSTTSQLSKNPLINGILHKNIQLETGKTNSIKHKLDRALIGWIVVRQRDNSSIWDSQDSNKTKNITLDLLCSSNTTVDLWVF